MKKTFLYILVLFLMPILNAQDNEEINWYTVNDIEQLLAENPRPVFIDTYTDWCGWCKEYDKTTFSEPVIIEYLNENFYPVKFDAESKETVTFLGNEFKNDGKYGKSHPLAVGLLRGQMSFPTVVFLNEKGELLTTVPGYKKPFEFEPLLVFIHEKRYETQTFEEFMKSFKGSF